MSKASVRRWHIRFSEGDGLTPVSDLQRSGRPRTQSAPPKVEAVQEIINNDRRTTLKEIAQKTAVSLTTAHRIVKKNLKLSRKVAKFVPRLLTDDQKRMRVECC